MRISALLAPWVGGNELIAETTAPSSPAEPAHTYSKTKLVLTILLFRVCYLFAMAVSCELIPDHNPGDGVLKFDMRLNHTDHCYCLRGHACDYEIPNSIGDSDCAIPSSSQSLVSPRLWNFFLAPLTKWDAARFLTLAVNPSLRDPKQHVQPSSSPSSFPSWEDSEQAHAFLPMFPLTIQQFSFLLHRTLPAKLSPPTFESLVVLGGMIFNNFICLTVATLALYDLTVVVMRSAHPRQERKQYYHFVAIVVCLVFGVWNPALVFFATNYSESFFAATSLCGHLCIQWSKSHGSIILWLAGIACWMVGSYTRSNGTLHCLWVLQDGLARAILLLRDQYSVDQYSKLKAKTKTSILCQAVGIGIQSVMGALLIVLPVRYHDSKGIERHCVGAEIRPSWCSYSAETQSSLSSSFSLYGHIQDKHWNVGFFRYYEWKQIPNFLLASPILILSITGVYRWIHCALITEYGKGKSPSSYEILLVRWPLHALSESVSVSGGNPTSTTSKTEQPALSSVRHLLLENPLLLGHYALLAILTFIGLVIAHVQISTRMICSTSPAIIWFIAYCILPLSSQSLASGDTSKSKQTEKNTNRSSPFMAENRPRIVWFYLGLYMFLGLILHVNFLPWT